MLILSTMFIALPSCSDDKDEPDGDIKTNIIGTWEGTAVNFDGQWIDITQYPYSSVLGFSATFYENGSYYGSGAFGNGSGTYKIKGSTVETYVGGKLYLTYKVKSMTGTSAEITIIDGSGDTMDARIRKTK